MSYMSSFKTNSFGHANQLIRCRYMLLISSVIYEEKPNDTTWFMLSQQRCVINVLPDVVCLATHCRIEVKACRANSTKSSGSLASRAYLHTEAHDTGFKYHYQQLKPSCCDVFIWIGTCRDTLLYWVLSSDELLKTGKLGSQHRNEHTGTADNPVFEGQVFMTEDELLPFFVKEENILDAVYAKGKSKIDK